MDVEERGAKRKARDAGLIRERLDDWCEKGILGLVLAILVFGPLAMGAVNRWQFLVIQGLTLGVMALWGLRLWVNKRPQLLWPPICYAVVAFVIYAIVRYCQADIEFVARQELIRILVYAFLFFAIINNLHRQEAGKIITLTLVFLGMVISFYAAYQFLVKSSHVWNLPSRYPGRGSGTFVYPNSLAGFLEMLVPLGLSYVLIGRLSHVTKILLGYASLAMVAGIAVTLSRGGWAVAGAVLVVFCVVMIFQRHYRIQALLLLGVMLAIGIFAIPKAEIMQQRVQSTFLSGRADDLRLGVWPSAVRMWQDHFWLGVGPAHFDQRFPQYRPVGVQARPVWAHNDYLNTLADWGLVGAALVTATWALLYWGVWRAWKFVRGPKDDFARKKSNRFAFSVGASMGLLAILLHSAVDFNMQIPAIAILAVTLMALLSSQIRFATERYWFRLGTVLKCLATMVLLAGVGYLGGEGWRSGREYFWFQQAGRVPEASNERIAALEHAFQAEPMNAETAYAIGESYRTKSFYGNDQYVTLARKAMGWYQRGMKLAPYEGNNWLRYGMCLDWIGTADGGNQEDSAPAYKRANELDPNGFATSADIGWHYVQIGDLAAARSWFERSLQLEWVKAFNPVAYDYLPIVERKLEEAAAEQNRLSAVGGKR